MCRPLRTWHPGCPPGTNVVLWALSSFLHVMSWEPQSILSLLNEVLLCARLCLWSSDIQIDKTNKVPVPPPASFSSELSLALPCSVLCYVVGGGEPTFAGGSLLDSTNGGSGGVYGGAEKRRRQSVSPQPCLRWPLWLWLCLFCGSVSRSTGLLNTLWVTPGPGLGKLHPLSFSPALGEVSASCYFFLACLTGVPCS